MNKYRNYTPMADFTGVKTVYPEYGIRVYYESCLPVKVDVARSGFKLAFKDPVSLDDFCEKLLFAMHCSYLDYHEMFGFDPYKGDPFGGDPDDSSC